MGVRFYDKENMSTEDNYTTNTNTSCSCNTCYQQTLTSPATTATSKTTNCQNSGNNLNYVKSGILREIVGNCKEMRIEDNRHNLRIVGNNNRIRILFNVGDVTIIGNNTRLKITTNHGHIKYTGNDGRISLGKDSKEQVVDYSGCNGVLKLQNSKKSSQVDDDDKIKNHHTVMGSTNINRIAKTSKNPKEKNAAYSDSASDSEILKKKCTNYSNIFKRKISLPNEATKSVNSDNRSSIHAHQLPTKTVVNNFGNIVIANSSNICISPSSYTYR